MKIKKDEHEDTIQDYKKNMAKLHEEKLNL